MKCIEKCEIFKWISEQNMESLSEWKNSEEILEEFLQNGNECEMKNEMKRKETEK